MIFLLPQLKQGDIAACLLEVITENERAIPNYQAIGFEIVREFICYSGHIESMPGLNPGLRFEWVDRPRWDSWQACWSWHPSWQNDSPAVERISVNYRLVEAWLEDQFAGYAAYVPEEGYLAQFAVPEAFRGRGIGKRLFDFVYQDCGMGLRLINVDAGDAATLSFLDAIGMQETIRQYEMEWYI